MYRAADFAMNRFPFMRRMLNRHFYQFLARLDEPHGAVTLMNYGYADLNRDASPLFLEPQDEGNRYCLQLYHHVASAVDLRGKDVLEIGCGRGGGASYVRRYLSPRSVTGVDYSERAIQFCQRHHVVDGLRYVHGDAEDLPFDDEGFDAAINIESSHCYGAMEHFLREVHRVLRPGGYLLWADHRPPDQVLALRDDIRRAGFEVMREEFITQNVLAAMRHQGEHNMEMIRRGVPRFLHRIFAHFAGVEGTLIHRRFASGELVYLHMVMRKVESEASSMGS